MPGQEGPELAVPGLLSSGTGGMLGPSDFTTYGDGRGECSLARGGLRDSIGGLCKAKEPLLRSAHHRLQVVAYDRRRDGFGRKDPALAMRLLRASCGRVAR